jgi:uncharacterized membrane protein
MKRPHRARANVAPMRIPGTGDRAREGDRLAGVIYGTIVALSVVVGAARAYPHEPGHGAVLVAFTSAVFWLAHVYAHSLGESVMRDERLTLAEMRTIARRELAVVEAAIFPVAALLLGTTNAVNDDRAYWLAFAFGMIVLIGQGLRFASIERLGFARTLAVVSANAALGLLLAALKLYVSH